MSSCDGLITMGPRSMPKRRPFKLAEERTDLNVGEVVQEQNIQGKR